MLDPTGRARVDKAAMKKKNLKKKKAKHLHSPQLHMQRSCSPWGDRQGGHKHAAGPGDDLKAGEQQLKVETCDLVTFW